MFELERLLMGRPEFGLLKSLEHATGIATEQRNNSAETDPHIEATLLRHLLLVLRRSLVPGHRHANRRNRGLSLIDLGKRERLVRIRFGLEYRFPLERPCRIGVHSP